MKLLIKILIALLIPVIILGIVIYCKYNLNAKKYELYSVSELEEPYNNLDYSYASEDVIDNNAKKYELYSVSELEELYNNLDYSYAPKDFVDSKLENYQRLHSSNNSFDNSNEAIEYMKKEKLDSTEKLLDWKLEESEYYYAIYHSYISYSGTYVFMKNSILDLANKKVNVKMVNCKDKVKKLFNEYVFVINCQNGSINIVDSSVTENINKYIYTVYYFTTSIGDWGQYDKITLKKRTIEIKKDSGNFSYGREIELNSFLGVYRSTGLYP